MLVSTGRRSTNEDPVLDAGVSKHELLIRIERRKYQRSNAKNFATSELFAIVSE